MTWEEARNEVVTRARRDVHEFSHDEAHDMAVLNEALAVLGLMEED